jgi:hypothetical protein
MGVGGVPKRGFWTLVTERYFCGNRASQLAAGGLIAVAYSSDDGRQVMATSPMVNIRALLCIHGILV